MKSSVQTRIFLSLTPEEARAAVNDAIDLQLCVRSALYQIDGTPVAILAAQNGRLLAAPKKHKHVVHRRKASIPRKMARKPTEIKECQYCHRQCSARQIGKHMRACKAKPLPNGEQP